MIRIARTLAAITLAAIGAASICHAASMPRMVSLQGTQPGIESNLGQADSAADFVIRGQDHAALIAADRVTVSLNNAQAPSTVLSMRLVGADPHAAKSGVGPAVGVVNYLFGDQPQGWRTGIPSYQAVRYSNVYPGIDAVYYHRGAQFEYDLVVHPGANPRAAVLEFEGAARIARDAQGDLLVHDAAGVAMRMHKPVAYQDVGGQRQPVDCDYLVEGKRVLLAVASYDPRQPLIVDPVVQYRHVATGSRGSAAWAVAVDAQGNAYITGDTSAVDFPISGGAAQKAHKGSSDAFVTKLRPDGTIAYSTYLGGSGSDVGYAIAVDAAGNAYVAGDTRSTDFPLVNPLQRKLNGAADAFVAKLSPDGSTLLYSTYVGGASGDRAQGIAVGADGSVVVAGYTHSTDFPTEKPFQKEFAGGNADAFVFKLTPAGSAFVYSSFLGGGNDRPDIGTAIALDREGNAYLTGFTNSVEFPVRSVAQPFIGPTDAFVTKVSPTGQIVYSTHIGGAADDEAMGIAVDDEGSAYITGQTESVDFPVTAGAYRTKCKPVKVAILAGEICEGGDVFVVKLTPQGNRIAYSTFIGGSGFEVGRAIAVDKDRNAYVVGLTTSPDFPVVNAVQSQYGGGKGYDAFAFKLDPTGAKLLYSTYLGGDQDDGAYGVGVSPSGEDAYVAGYTRSSSFLGSDTGTAPQAAPMSRAFVVRLSEPAKK